MSGSELVLAAVVVAVGAALQGGVGFGMNLLAAPLLALLDPDFVPGPAIAAALVLTILVAIREREHVDRRGVWFASLGRVPGTVVGALLIASISSRATVLVLGAAVLVAAALSVTRLRLRPTAGTLVAAGIVSGFGTTVSSIGGPPVAVVYANEAGPVVRGSLSLIFVIGGVMSLTALIAVGEFGAREAAISSALLVPGALGFLASRRLATYLDEGRTRRAVLVAAVLGALAVLARELL